MVTKLWRTALSPTATFSLITQYGPMWALAPMRADAEMLAVG